MSTSENKAHVNYHDNKQQSYAPQPYSSNGSQPHTEPRRQNQQPYDQQTHGAHHNQVPINPGIAQYNSQGAPVHAPPRKQKKNDGQSHGDEQYQPTDQQTVKNQQPITHQGNNQQGHSNSHYQTQTGNGKRGWTVNDENPKSQHQDQTRKNMHQPQSYQHGQPSDQGQYRTDTRGQHDQGARQGNNQTPSNDGQRQDKYPQSQQRGHHQGQLTADGHRHDQQPHHGVKRDKGQLKDTRRHLEEQPAQHHQRQPERDVDRQSSNKQGQTNRAQPSALAEKYKEYLTNDPQAIQDRDKQLQSSRGDLRPSSSAAYDNRAYQSSSQDLSRAGGDSRNERAHGQHGSALQPVAPSRRKQQHDMSQQDIRPAQSVPNLSLDPAGTAPSKMNHGRSTTSLVPEVVLSTNNLGYNPDVNRSTNHVSQQQPITAQPQSKYMSTPRDRANSVYDEIILEEPGETSTEDRQVELRKYRKKDGKPNGYRPHSTQSAAHMAQMQRMSSNPSLYQPGSTWSLNNPGGPGGVQMNPEGGGMTRSTSMYSVASVSTVNLPRWGSVISVTTASGQTIVSKN